MLSNISRCNHFIRKTSSLVSNSLNSPQRTILSSTSVTPVYILNQFTSKNCNTVQLTSVLSAARNMANEAKTDSQVPKHTNRLAQEKSPYLLQHAHNPVDWYPWSDEAINRARSENKPIFLSIGYSTCHWCHVMERESFENEEIAKIMNQNYINIKVDREERPDIDKIYMQYVVLINGSGGWPMSVWLTPDLTPIAAGTYFPPVNRYGMPSFSFVLNKVLEKWVANPDQLKSAGGHIMASISKSLSEKNTSVIFEPGSSDLKLQECLQIFKEKYDLQYGGFGTKPKFPEVSKLNFLFHAYIATKDADLLEFVLNTLNHIGNGGIHDHIFGGFSRYAVDRTWHVPHFEKMLYDQGQLMASFAHAYKLTHNEKYLRWADGIFEYINKDLRHPAGGFYSGEDADSLPKENDTEKIEGAFYAWDYNEIEEVILENSVLYDSSLPKKQIFKIYSQYYDLQPEGNVQVMNDPQRHFQGKNILIIRKSEDEICTKYNISNDQLEKIVYITNDLLHTIRNKRPRPHLDTKIICSWNGLVLSGLCKLGNCYSPKRDEYMETAKQLVDFIRQNFFNSTENKLHHSCYGVDTKNPELSLMNNEPPIGFLDDYVFLIKGLLDYYKATLDTSILNWAKNLQDIQDSLFWDDVHGAYFYSQANSANVVARIKEDHDGAEPSGNSLSARNLVLLAHYADDENYRNRAQKILDFYADCKPFGYIFPQMMSAMMLFENGLDLVAVVGPDSDTTNRFVEICRKFYIPGMIILHIDPQQPEGVPNQSILNKFKMINGKTTVYMCHERVCRMPVTDPDKLEENLMENFFKKN